MQNCDLIQQRLVPMVRTLGCTLNDTVRVTPVTKLNSQHRFKVRTDCEGSLRCQLTSGKVIGHQGLVEGSAAQGRVAVLEVRVCLKRQTCENCKDKWILIKWRPCHLCVRKEQQ